MFDGDRDLLLLPIIGTPMSKLFQVIACLVLAAFPTALLLWSKATQIGLALLNLGRQNSRKITVFLAIFRGRN